MGHEEEMRGHQAKNAGGGNLHRERVGEGTDPMEGKWRRGK